MLQDIQATSEIGLHFKPAEFKFEDAILISIHDASWANEEKIIDGHIFPRRSQYGRITCMGHPDLWDGDTGIVHFIGWKPEDYAEVHLEPRHKDVVTLWKAE